MSSPAGAPDPEGARDVYSQMFEKLVDGADDVVLGMIAYGIYKKPNANGLLSLSELKAGRQPTRKR